MTSTLVPKPFNDQERIEALQALGLLDTPPEAGFDRITRLACAVMRTPIALVSLVDESRQWFKSRCGLDMESTPREVAFCAHAIMSDEVLLVLDATKDPRFQNNPLVTGEGRVRFYAGAPLITRDGFRIGSLCAIDTEPRAEVTEQELDLMKEMAVMTVEVIEGRHAVRHATEVLSEHLTAAAQRAEAGENAKANLIAMLGHELRTPLNAIIGFSEVLAAQIFGPMSKPQYTEYAEHIRESGEHLLGVINTMLNLASCERGEINLKEEILDSAKLVENCAGMMSEQARKAGVELKTEVGADLPSLKADRNQVVQMLLNLIANGVKFNRPNGTVRIVAEQAEGQAVLSVIDTGIGMAPEELNQSRGVFDQLDSGLDRNFEGLGLPLTDRLIELHGGKLELESTEGQGTTATLTFPAWRSVTEAAAAAPLGAAQAP